MPCQECLAMQMDNNNVFFLLEYFSIFSPDPAAT